MDLILKGVLAGAIVMIVMAAARSGKENLAGLIVLFPAITFLSYFFIAQEQGSKALQGVVTSSLLAAPTWIVTIGVVALCLPHMDYKFALGIGLVAWLVSALVYLLIRA